MGTSADFHITRVLHHWRSRALDAERREAELEHAIAVMMLKREHKRNDFAESFIGMDPDDEHDRRAIVHLLLLTTAPERGAQE